MLAGLSPKAPFKSPQRPPKSPRDRLSAPGYKDNARPNVSAVKENHDIQYNRRPATNTIHHRSVPSNIKDAVRNFTTTPSSTTAGDLVTGLENVNIGDSNDNSSSPAAEINDNGRSIASNVIPDSSDNKNPKVNIITSLHAAKKNNNAVLDIEESTATQTDTVSKKVPSCDLNALRELQELHQTKARPIIYIYILKTYS